MKSKDFKVIPIKEIETFHVFLRLVNINCTKLISALLLHSLELYKKHKGNLSIDDAVSLKLWIESEYKELMLMDSDEALLHSNEFVKLKNRVDVLESEIKTKQE